MTLLIGTMLGFMLGCAFMFVVCTRPSEDYPLDRPVRRG